MTPLILASASERRKRILETLRVAFTVMIPEADEITISEDPRGTAVENARRKHNACRAVHSDAYIIAADTVIDFRGRVIAKPLSMEEAVSFFRAFSGASHTVLTAVALGRPKEAAIVDVMASTVRFKRLADPEIRAYFSRVDPMDKAGAYDIDQHGEMIVESYKGSYSNIMGLPREPVVRWLERIGWQPSRIPSANGANGERRQGA